MLIIRHILFIIVLLFGLSCVPPKLPPPRTIATISSDIGPVRLKRGDVELTCSAGLGDSVGLGDGWKPPFVIVKPSQAISLGYAPSEKTNIIWRISSKGYEAELRRMLLQSNSLNLLVGASIAVSDWYYPGCILMTFNGPYYAAYKAEIAPVLLKRRNENIQAIGVAHILALGVQWSLWPVGILRLEYNVLPALQTPTWITENEIERQTITWMRTFNVSIGVRF